METRVSFIPFALMALLGLSACAPTTEVGYKGAEGQPSKAGIGASVGAVAGALIGAVTAEDDSDRARNMIIGGVAGGLAGGAAGSYMDSQEKELRQSLQESGVAVERHEDRINLVIPGDVTFATASSDIHSQFYPTLNQIAQTLIRYPDTSIYVIGHTDNQGSFEYNQALSERRAVAVATFLANSGVAYQRVATAGRSFNQPKASNDTAEGRALNRRVELTLVPSEKLARAN